MFCYRLWKIFILTLFDLCDNQKCSVDFAKSINCQFLLVIKIQQKLLIQRGIPQIMRQTDVNLHKTKRERKTVSKTNYGNQNGLICSFYYQTNMLIYGNSPSFCIKIYMTILDALPARREE